MKITIAGQDRTAEFEPVLAAEISRMEATGTCVGFPPEIAATRLRGQPDESAYLEVLSELVRRRHHIDTVGFRIPRKPGLAGAVMSRVRAFLWKLLRYQHNRMAFRQNLVNSHLAALLELQGVELAKLRKRIEELERRTP